MKILIKNTWQDGFLDYYRHPHEYRIQVEAIRNLERLTDVYIVRPKSPRLVLNYLRQIGFRGVLRKIRSRLGETARNEKYVSCGLGTVLEAPANACYPRGSRVAFLAPLHPAAVERITLPPDFLFPTDVELPRGPSLLHAPLSPGTEGDAWWIDVRGWSLYSGTVVSEALRQQLALGVAGAVARGWDKARPLSVSPERPIKESEIRESHHDRHSTRKRAVLFGLGNYAKVHIIPEVKKSIDLVAIHEIDPTQIPRNLRVPYLDSSPLAREDEDYEVVLIAGYHHTHAPLAVRALESGAYVVVEKPLVVNEEQAEQLEKAVARNGRKFFAGFHKRYSPLNAFVRSDLNRSKGDPVSCHCVVYESPYPPLFWYYWPNSPGPVVENGCHWIDYFLYLNGFAKPIAQDVFVAGARAFSLSVKLENGAFFTLAMSQEGASCLGVQDYVELRSQDKTVRLINDSIYSSENRRGLIRKTKVNKMANYHAMYADISKRIAADEEGDTLESVTVSNRLILRLERAFKESIESNRRS